MTHCGMEQGGGIYAGKRVCLIIRRQKGEEAWTGERPRVASLKRVIAASRFGSGLPHVSGAGGGQEGNG